MQSQRSSSPQPSPTAIDSENQVVFFADPCAMCGTKKRRVCPLHQKFNPRKKLFAEPSPPLTTTLPPLFHTTNSVFQSTDHQSSSSHEDHHSKTTTLPQKYLDPSFVINTTPEKIKIQSTTQRTGTTTNLSTIVEESSPESASQQSQAQSQQRETSLRNWVHDSNGRSSSGKGKKITKSPLSEEDLECLSSGTEDESHNTSPLGSHQRHNLRSPVSASKPPRPPKRRQSVNNARPGSPTRNNGGDPGVRSPDSETKQGGGGGSSEDKESLNALKECVGMFNKLLSSGLLNNLQDRSPQEIIHQKKGIMELIDSENILKGERGVYKGSCLCSCGKKYQMILSILPE
ncbi:hypothetical protein ACHQM5_022885 [Ranunculus cassubicifolius]